MCRSFFIKATDKNVSAVNAARFANAVAALSLRGVGPTMIPSLDEVNEFLKQLEDFDGCFFAATNLVESLDPAAMRRFDYRLQFDWLPLAARLALLEAQLDRFAVSERLDCGQRQARLAGLPWLLPGDFAALRRRAEAAMPALSETQLLDWLIDIQAAKPEARRRPMGFQVSELSRAAS